ncbi:septum site-determining protein MinC [Halalkalibacterium halodurans]|jgi:septum site-determining protein MinC|uniref:Probable septum site-determining protein MinC n=2 Tax=Halalkalibacterium halodurans TaxID=86665 RepID=MINC_HALH5|nr:septum site-determining protein MinC [Halalkalibacterium halodurans]Q9K8H8.1 RecName: Full=Probable septum site-determining protein MinC [Halalkalibacterium halodurans C-125]MDY7223573.1 septum site-determining protein MinC [Halalkalibacterium halodurans]MDY7242794.1 septum site-determining protein MinC [Halalkalibacterium halodurans]MED3646593.1 septum site-determining protein MinC [Halalkalibacterium halodurans]MED4082219.1 septum site-determining protein MinC [Halalkalibacterium halodura
MTTQKKQAVTIKGTKDGLTFHLDDRCSFDSIVGELAEKLSSKHYQMEDQPRIQVKVDVGYRYLTVEQKRHIQELITDGRNLDVEEFVSQVMTKEEAEEKRKEAQIVSVAKVIRSGQVFSVDGDLLLIGDVNPGGTIRASGNIFVIGSLRGIAHAGYKGNGEAVIATSHMAPAQLRIGEQIFHWSKEEQQAGDRIMECAYIASDTNEIQLDRVQKLLKIRPNLATFLDEMVEQ